MAKKSTTTAKDRETFWVGRADELAWQTKWDRASSS